MANARAKAEQADQAALKAEQDSDMARLKAKQFAPEFQQPGSEVVKKGFPKQNPDGQTHLEDRGYSPLDIQQNHNIHQRSSSTLMPNDKRLGGLSPQNTDQKFGPTPKTSSQADFSFLSVNNSLLQSPNAIISSQENATPNQSPHHRNPSLKIRRYSFLAGSMRGRGFSELFNSTVLNDHFDQYSAQKDDSDLGRDFLSTDDHVSRSLNPSDTSPDSGVSESWDDGRNALPRRRTLPCIVTNDENDNSAKAVVKEQAHSSENLARKNVDEYIIENGIRKRVKGITKNPQPLKRAASRKALPYEFEIERPINLTRSGKRGSLPDVTAIQKTEKSPISREEAYKLGTARREEIRNMQDLAQRRRHGDVTVILEDLRDFVQQRQLLVLVIAFNLSLATMFFNMFS